MRLRSAKIERFKVIRELAIDFRREDSSEILRRMLLLGDNATGKTTVLQAIALPLALATGDIERIEDIHSQISP
jgi:predicted ATP-dependent endonuclease of OLD family